MDVSMGKEGTYVAWEYFKKIIVGDNFATIFVAVKEGHVVRHKHHNLLLTTNPDINS